MSTTYGYTKEKYHVVFGSVLPDDAFISGIPAGAETIIHQRNDEFVTARVRVGDKCSIHCVLTDDEGNYSLGWLLAEERCAGYPNALVRLACVLVHPIYVAAWPLRKAYNVLADDCRAYRAMLDDYTR